MMSIGLIGSVFVGLILIVLVVGIITAVTVCTNARTINNMQNVYIGRLANRDSSIKDAMQYLKLTNGIEQSDGEEK